MEENKTTHVNCTDCHHPKDDCCCPEKPKPIKNECMQCCDSLEFKCPDIRRATCVPILGERIYDFKCINKKQERVVEDLKFNITCGTDSFANGAKVCIEKILVTYDCLGFTNETLQIIIDSTSSPLTGSTLSCSTAALTLYASYSGTVNQKLLCCEDGRNVNLVQGPLKVGAINVIYTVQGKIDGEPFVAVLADTPSTGSIPEFQSVTLYNNICLPQVSTPVDVKANFQLEILPKCIIPTSGYDSTTKSFTANVFDSLSVKEKFYVTIKDELVVYTAFDGLECGGDCHHK
ncbi:MAG: hypothetical protein RR835_07980 [Peptostreptococcaceae bacterium]